MAKDRSPSNHSEQSGFREAMQDVRRLKSDRVTPYRNKPRPIPTQTHREQQQVVREMFSDPVDDADIETGEELLFARPGLQHGLMRRLRRGHLPLEKELDLHGKTSQQARELLALFLKECTERGVRVVRVIHGKGLGSRNKMPILKTKVNHWLQQRDEVLAFCSARPHDGGTGAIYVLLKKGK